MATFKSYSDLEQSRRLAKILPLESADMFYADLLDDNKHKYNVHILESYGLKTFEDTKTRESKRLSFLPCWSLSALLSVIPKTINFGYENDSTFVLKPLTNGKYLADYYEISYVKDNPVDACVEMILKLHKQKLL